MTKKQKTGPSSRKKEEEEEVKKVYVTLGYYHYDDYKRAETTTTVLGVFTDITEARKVGLTWELKQNLSTYEKDPQARLPYFDLKPNQDWDDTNLTELREEVIGTGEHTAHASGYWHEVQMSILT